MRIEQQMVAEFHKAAGDSDPIVPTMPSLEVRILRAKLMLEECVETIVKGLGIDFNIIRGVNLSEYNFGADPAWFEAHPGSLEEIADGCADLKYVTYGTELACGIDGGPVFDEVHKSNMTKFAGGQQPQGGGKKIQKGPAFRPPDIAGVLEQQKHQLPASVLAYEQKAITEMMRSVMEQREDILKAFVAKYGWEPDRTIQVIENGKWYVRQRTDEEMAQAGFRYPDTPEPSKRAPGPTAEPQYGIWVSHIEDSPETGSWLLAGSAPWYGSLDRAEELAEEKQDYFPAMTYEVLPFRYYNK